MNRPLMYRKGGGLKQEGGKVDEVSGNKVPLGGTKEGVRDDIDANLSAGEWVADEATTRYHGLKTFLSMRDEAMMGMKKMEAMGLMGNADEATLPTDMPFGMADLIIVDVDDKGNEKEIDMAAGGLVFNQGGMAEGQQGETISLTSQQQTPVRQRKKVTFDEVMAEAKMEFKEYRNSEGQSLMVPFIGGVPLYPIPEGYTLYTGEGSEIGETELPTTGAEDLVPNNDDDDYMSLRQQMEEQRKNKIVWSELSDEDFLAEANRRNGFGRNLAMGIAALISPLASIGMNALMRFEDQKVLKMARERLKALPAGSAQRAEYEKMIESYEARSGGLFGGIIDKIIGSVGEMLGLTEEQKTKGKNANLVSHSRNIDTYSNANGQTTPAAETAVESGEVSNPAGNTMTTDQFVKAMVDAESNDTQVATNARIALANHIGEELGSYVEPTLLANIQKGSETRSAEQTRIDIANLVYQPIDAVKEQLDNLTEGQQDFIGYNRGTISADDELVENQRRTQNIQKLIDLGVGAELATASANITAIKSDLATAAETITGLQSAVTTAQSTADQAVADLVQQGVDYGLAVGAVDKNITDLGDAVAEQIASLGTSLGLTNEAITALINQDTTVTEALNTLAGSVGEVNNYRDAIDTLREQVGAIATEASEGSGEGLGTASGVTRDFTAEVATVDDTQITTGGEADPTGTGAVNLLEQQRNTQVQTLVDAGVDRQLAEAAVPAVSTTFTSRDTEALEGPEAAGANATALTNLTNEVDPYNIGEQGEFGGTPAVTTVEEQMESVIPSVTTSQERLQEMTNYANEAFTGRPFDPYNDLGAAGFTDDEIDTYVATMPINQGVSTGSAMTTEATEAGETQDTFGIGAAGEFAGTSITTADEQTQDVFGRMTDDNQTSNIVQDITAQTQDNYMREAFGIGQEQEDTTPTVTTVVPSQEVQDSVTAADITYDAFGDPITQLGDVVPEVSTTQDTQAGTTGLSAFEQEFAKAKAAGEPTFTFNGQSYTTETAEEKAAREAEESTTVIRDSTGQAQFNRDETDTSGETESSVVNTNAVNRTGDTVVIGQTSAGGQDAGDGFVWVKNEGTNALTRQRVDNDPEPAANNNNNDDRGSSNNTTTASAGRSEADIQADINAAVAAAGPGGWTDELNDLVAERDAARSNSSNNSNNNDGGNDNGGNDNTNTGGGGGGPCFLTTAIVERRGEADDGPTLTKLRHFRDTYLSTKPNEVQEYYEVAPKIVSAIPENHNEWNWIGEQIDTSIKYIDQGKKDLAYKTYKAMVDKLRKNWLQ